jgi:L-lysine exporter family protein LysE/ArgO
MIEAAIQGYLVALSLILAIGAQNAFVLRQGIRGEHVLAVVLVCAVSDALLIGAGVAGFGAASARFPWLGEAMRWGGVAFLLVYGALRFRAAFRGGEALRPAQDAKASMTSVLGTCLVLTWANPHVYLDTVALIGSISAQYAPYRPPLASRLLAGHCRSSPLLGSVRAIWRRFLPVRALGSCWKWGSV